MKKRITTQHTCAQFVALVGILVLTMGFQPVQADHFAAKAWQLISNKVKQQLSTISPQENDTAGLDGSMVDDPCLGANLGGIVWQDYNANGVKDASETVGVPGVTVQVYDCNGLMAASDVTDNYGNWYVNPAGISFPVRVEFSNLPAWANSTFNGTHSATSVQFVAAASCTVHFGVANPADYCGASNPLIVLACYESGNAFYGATGNENKGIISFPYNSSGPTPTGINGVADIYEVGTVWGMGWQRKNKRMFTSALLKRHSGLGPKGMGGVYVMDFASGTGSVVTSFDLQGVVPSNGGPAINVGSINRTGTDYQLPNANNVDNWDLDAFDKIGKVGFGDADVSPDDNTLWLVNLNQRALITVDVSSTSTYPGTVKQYPLSSATGLPSCTNGILRPWGLAFDKGRGYLGCVCSAETGGTSANLQAYVLSFNPANPTAFTTEVSFPLNYTREKAVDFPTYSLDIPGAWRPWVSTWAGTGYSNSPPSETGYPQPIVSDIDFADNGSMVIGIADRFGFQMGRANYIPVSGDNSQTSGDVAGDIIKVCRIDGAWVLEGGAGCSENDDASKSALGNDGPSSTGEFYYQDSFDDTNATPTYNHNETFIGSVGVVKGKNEVVAVHYDPINGANFAWDLGILWHSPATGARTDQFRIIDSGPAESKGNGLGDVDMVCSSAPIQIGNVVWNDADFDGTQDPCESGLNGVVVKLYKMDAGTTTLIATTSTATVNGKAGSWYFKDYEQYGTGYDTLQPGKMYFVTLGETGQFNTTTKTLTISGTKYELTDKDSGEGTNPDLNDSDAYLLSDNTKPFNKYPVLTVTIGNPGYTNHSLDAGFGLLRPPYIGPDKVVCNDGSVEFIAYPNSTNLTDSIPGTWIVNVQDGSEADPPGAVGDSVLTIAFNNQNFVSLVDTVVFTAANGLTDTVLVTVLPAIKGYENYSGCEGDGYSVTVNGVVYDETNPSGTQVMTSYQGCDSIITINLVFNSIAVFANVTDVTTYGGNDGGIDMSMVTHNSPYTFDWDNDGVGDNDDPEDLTGLSAGTYTVTITDASGCTKIESFTVMQPPCDLSIGMDIYDVTCNGGLDGQLDMTIFGGIAPFTVDWDNDGIGDHDDTEDLTGIAAGSYSVTVTDASGCTTEGSFDINQPNAITLPGTVTHLSGLGSNDGSIDLSPSGGTLPYTFDWSNDGTGDNDDQEDISGLAPGPYFVTLTDGAGCTKTASFTVNATNCNLSFNMNVQDVSCHNGMDGQLDMTIVGGTAPFSIDWDNDGTGDNDDTQDLTGLEAGSYAVTVTDASGCTASGSFDVNQPNAINISGTVTDVSIIGGTDGEIDLSVTGGTFPYSFDWNNDGVGDNDDPEDLTNLAEGDYSVIITDAAGCTATASFMVNEPPCALSISINVQDASCQGNMDGGLDMTISNGAAPYTIDWNNDGVGDNDDTEDLTGLSAGSYSVTVTDINGCSDLGTFMVNEPSVLTVDWVVVDVSTPGGSDGFINLTISGGTSPFAFDWDNDGFGDNDDTEDLTNIAAGDYAVIVTDAAGCTATEAFIVNQPSCDLALNADTQDVTCFGGANGAIDLTVTGGALPYTFDWDSDGTGDNNDPEDLAGLDADTYSVTVTDANGCTKTGAYGVSQPDQIVLSAIIGPISGMGVNDGWIDLTVAGGTTPYTYDWSNDGVGDNNDPQDIGGLGPNTYHVTVTDGFGCTKTGSYVISPADFFDLALRKTPASGQAATVQPGATVTFTITVFNQGSVGATDILVIDYLQPFMTYASSDNPGWVNFGAGPTWFISALPAGASISKNIKLKVAANAPNGSVLNYAEISAADDNDPNTFDPPIDIDSNPNAYQFDDPGGLPGSPADDVITGNGTGTPGSNDPATDEDDHDGAAVQVLIPTLSLGNQVFADLDNDGIFNNLDAGIPNVAVQLYNAGPDQQANTADDQLVASQNTDSNGKYQFTGLSAGYYFVKLTGVGIPANYVSSTGQGVMDYDGAGPYEPASGTDLNVDNTDDGTQMGAMVISGVIQLTLNGEPEGNVNNTVDFGLYEPQIPTLSLGGTIFSDENNDGIFSNPETGIGSVEVELYDAGPDQIKGTADDLLVGSQLATANGEYLFTGLPEGFYYVKLTGIGIPAYHVSSTGDGIFDNDGAGAYEPAPGANNDVDNVDDGTQMGAMIMTGVIQLTINGEPDGNENYTVDFGLYEPQSLSLGNLVFADLENDGIFNNSDDGIQGVEVQLYSAGPDQTAGTADDQLLDSQFTNAVGEYQFTGLTDGFYFVKLTGIGIPANYVSSTGDGINDMDGMGPFEPATGTNSNVDGTDDGTQMGLMVLSGVIELTLNGEPDGNTNNTVDFGLYEPFVQPTLSLGNLVFVDLDNDGLYNNTDYGLQGVEVEIYDAGPDKIKGTADDQFLASQLTNSAGEYLFTGLADGFYFVKLTGTGIPTNHVSSTGDGIYDNDGAGAYEPATGANNDVDGDDDGTQMGAMVMSGVFELTINGEPDGNENYTLDFGLFEPQVQPTLSLGNLVFTDKSNDGLFNYGDTGISGVEVELYDAGPDKIKGTPDDQFLGSQLTNSAGEYLFTGLTEGFYFVKLSGVGIPTNHVSSTGEGVFDNDGAGPYEPASGTNNDVDNDDDGTQMGAMVMSGVIELAFNTEPDGNENYTVDFGLYVPVLPASLGNFVWYDNNHNGQQDYFETGVEAVSVNLMSTGPDGVKGGGDDNLVAMQLTNANGIYYFQNIVPGNYYVIFDLTSLPTNYDPTNQNLGDDLTDSDADAMGMTAVFTLASNEVNVTVDFGIEPAPSSIGNFVWQDYDGDGLQDGGEPGVEGITVKLYDLGNDGIKGGNDDDLIATDITDFNGEYSFLNLNPGSYYLVFEPQSYPNSFAPTTQDAGGNDAIDSDANAMGMTEVISLGAGEDDDSVDFGIFSDEFDLALTKTLSPGQSNQVDIGDEIAYTITVMNEGPNPVYAVNIVDHFPAGLILSANNAGWTLIGPNMAEYVIPGPIMPGQSEAVEIRLRVQYAASGATLENKAEVTSVEDINGDIVTDVDSTPNNDDPDEDDIDGAEIELIPHDPTGWIYCDKTGKIITGGTISVTGPNGIPNSQVFIIHDGINGYYEFFTDGTPGVYTLSYTHPLGYPVGLNCLDQPGPFDPTGMPNPIVFGVDTVNAMYLSDPTCASNPYYLTFDIEPGDPNINLNNLPVSCTFIGSIVCDDANLNDAIDAGDTPRPGATVYLYDCADLTTPIDSTISDGAGRYRFDGMLPGDYVVGFDLASGYRFVSSGNMNQTGFSDCITLAWGQCDTTKAICLYPCPTINAGPDVDHCSSANSSQLDANLSHGTGNFTWTPPTGLSNPNIENPVASPASTTTYHISFNDGFGCVAFDTIMVNVGTSVPYLTNMPFTDTTAQCAPLPFDPPIFADDCDTSLTVVMDTITTPQSCGYIQEVTWTATNDEGNSASFVQTITVEDTIAPTMSASHPFFGPIMHGDTLYADCSMIPSLDSLGFAAFDNCSATTVTFTENITNGNCPTDGFYQLRYCGWTATDACGNTDSLFFTVIIYDNSPPTLSPAPGDVTVSCSAIPPAAILSATDNCDASPTLVLDEYVTADTNGCITEILRVWTAEDDCGNTSVATQTITVFDNTPPTLVGVPANANLDCTAAVPAPANVTATDDCDNDVPVTFSQTITGNSSTGCYSITRTWTATDDCGNTVSASQTINITDTTPPTLAGVPANANYDCSQSVPFAATVTATDNCDSNVPVIFSEVINGNSSTGCFTIVRTWTATDDCGNTVSASQTINVTDTTPPILSGVPASATIPCEQTVPAPATVTASDACDSNVPVVYNQNINGNPATGCYVITRTWTATDDCGNTVSASQTINVEDNTAPTLSAYPADITVTCTSQIPVAPTLTATDNCDTNSPVLFFETNVGNPAGCVYQVKRTWAAADDCGNVVAWTQTIYVNDNVPPVLSAVPANTTINCGTPVPAPATVTATDNCDPNVPVTLVTTYIGDPTSGCYVVVRTWTATDDCGNTVSAKQEIGVIDNVAPNLIGLPANGAANCDNLPGSNVTATDNCDTNVPVVISDHVQSSVNGCPTQIIRTWTASDDCGNTRIASRTFNVTNNSAPVITILEPSMAGVQNGDTLYLECNDMPGLSAASAVGSADCCGPATVTFHETVVLGNCQTDGYLAKMNCGWTATDCCGNSSSLFFTVYMIDLTPPVLYGVPSDTILPVGSSVPPPPTVFAVDNCDNSMPISYNSMTAGPPTNQTTTRTWSATDDCGNTVTGTQIILITNDTTAPILSNVPADIVIEGPVANLPSSNGVTATDNLDNNPEITFVENRSGGICCYVVTRTWTATDDFGNSSTATQTITVTDTQAPIITGTVTDVSATCSIGDVPMPTLSATDNCTDLLTQNFSADTTLLACGFHVLRTWTFTDECGNTATAEQNIHVEDTEGPTFDPSSQIAISFLASQNATANGGVSLAIGDKISPNQTWSIGNQVMPNFAGIASDNCTAANEIGYRVSNIEETNNGCEHSFVVSFQVLDACGNAAAALFTASASFTDDAAPSFASVPQDLTVNCGNVPAPATLTATDNSGVVTVAFDETEVPGCPIILTRTWTATDGCGNTTVAKQKITVQDNAAPQITNVPASVAVSCGNIPPVSTSVVATDNCSGTVPLTFTETTASNNPNGTGCQYTITRTWTAVDACGNSAIKKQYIWVADHQAPTILTSLPSSFTVSCDAALPPAPTIAVSDNCDASPSVNFVETVLPGNDPTGVNCSYAVLRKWTVTDNCGNSTVAQQTIKVTDNTLPTLANIPSDITVNCGNIPVAPAILGADNCDTDVEVIFKETTTPGCPFSIVRNWIAVDNCGNQAEATQTIVVVDNQPPVLSAAPANLTLDCGDQVPAAITLTATDNCTANVQVNMVETTTASSCGQAILRTWTAIDDCGNSSSVSQLISFTDSEAPTVVQPVNLTVDCNELPPATTPVFSDNCDQNLSVHFTEIATPVTCGQNVLRTWTATDDCGNSTVVQQLIHVRDLSAPVMTFTNPVLMGLNSGDTLLFNCASNIIFNPSDVTATDACSNVTVNLTLVDYGNGNCLTDGYLVKAKFNWVATDACGNISILSLNVRVEDNDAPVFPNLPNIVVNCGDAAPDFITPDVVDDCGDVALSFASQNVPTGYGHNIVGTWTATDNCGNSATATQTIQVFDIGAAQLVGVPADTTIDLGSGEVIPPPAAVTAVNNCNGDTLFLIFDEDIQQVDPCNSVIDRRWSAVGPNGVTVMETQTITVFDNANFTASMEPDSCNTANGAVTLAPASLDFVWNDPNGASGATGAVRNDLAAGTYTVTATNANGCSSVAEVIVEAACNCDAANVKEVRKNVTGCGVSKGKAVIHLVQSVADYNYTWSPNLGVPNNVGNARTSLPAGHYEVTISLNSLASCVTVVSFDIDDDCAGCDEIFAEAPASINAPQGPVDICLPVAFGVSSNYEVRVDGHLFGGMLEPCDAHAVKVYNYATVPTGGSYSVVWQQNGSTFYTFVKNFAELVAAMNFADPAGKWYDDAASKELVTTRLNGNYGTLSIRHNASGTVTNLTVIATTSNTGTMLTLPSGGHTITYTNTVTGCSDELYVYVGPSETEVALEQPNEGASSVQPGTEVDSRATAPNAQADGIVVYNGFSPNGDGKNDFFKIDGLEQYPEHELKIFNGSGNMVFRTSHYLSDWGGSWGQNNLPDGTYYYLLEDGKGKTYSGYVQIKR